MLNNRLRNLRKQRELTLKQLSDHTGISVSFLSDVERGVTQPSMATLQRLADFYDTNITIVVTPLRTTVEPTEPTQPDSSASDITELDELAMAEARQRRDRYILRTLAQLRRRVGEDEKVITEAAGKWNDDLSGAFVKISENFQSMAETISALRAENVHLKERLDALEAWRQTMTGDGR